MITTVARQLFYLNSQRYEKSSGGSIANVRILDIQSHLSDNKYLIRARKMTLDFFYTCCVSCGYISNFHWFLYVIFCVV